jgi:uncharacterized membrane protein YdjX (TVP38/TMEM64 family)
VAATVWYRDWRIALGVALVATPIVLALLFDANAMLAAVQGRLSELRRFVSEHFLLSSLAFFLVYVVFTAVSIPGSIVLSMLGGAIFGLGWGLTLNSFGSTAGGALAMLASRYLLADQVRARYGPLLQRVDRELTRQGGFYLLSLRLNPVFPYFLVNILFGLTRVSTLRFWVISQLGMLPAAVIYTNAGAQLGELQSLEGLIEWQLLLALALVSLFPILVRLALGWATRPKDSAAGG